jgi:glycosyltransferase involved in cell wall biosynthesis
MEGIPVALMEALASGLPVVASALSGVPELVRDGETGWLVEPRDARAIATALEDVVRRPDEAAVRARAGRSLVAEDYDLHCNVRALARLLRTVTP